MEEGSGCQWGRFFLTTFPIDRFYMTVEKFIEWVCNKFNFGESNGLIRDSKRENHISIDSQKQIAKEEKE